MTIIVIVGCVVLWLFVQASLADAGTPPRSRGSLRYQRRKARKVGVQPDAVGINPRVSSGWEPRLPVGESHVADLAWSLSASLIGIIILFAGIVVIAIKGWGDLFFPWCGIMIFVLWLAQQRRKLRYKHDKHTRD